MTTNDWLKRLAIGTVLGTAAVTTVKVNEGYSEKAYYDSAKIATICYGETKGVKMGMVKTKAQCNAQLKESLADHARVLDKFPSSTPDVVALGVLDMGYNVGVYGFNSSQVKAYALKGDYKAAGQAVLKWKYITIKGKKYDCSTPGNKICAGLWERRKWQSKAIGNQFKSVQEAVDALNKLYH
jgi:GH24 family phage-related lysozyme (muramidase)